MAVDTPIQNALEWGAELATEITKNLEDGKFSFWEGVGLVDNGLGLIPVIKSMKHIPQDWEKLKKDEAYTDAIIAGIETKLSIPSEEAKIIVKQGVIAGIEVGKFVDLCAKAVKK